MNQLLTGDVWSQANTFLKGRGQKAACIAYVTSIGLNLASGDILICDASDFAIKNGETSAKAISHYLRKGAKVFSNAKLHAKLLLSKSHLVMGSANLSANSAGYLIESAVVTDDDTLISQARAFLFKILDSRETSPITADELSRILAIEVIRRTSRGVIGTKTQKQTFGSGTWFITTYEIKPRAYETIRPKVEKSTEKVAKEKNIDEDNIGFIKWRANTEFSKNVKPGDQLIVKEYNAAKTRCYVNPPSTVLKIEVVNGFKYIYHDCSNAGQRVLASKFQASTKVIPLNKPISGRTKLLDGNDLLLLRKIWK